LIFTEELNAAEVIESGTLVLLELSTLRHDGEDEIAASRQTSTYLISPLLLTVRHSPSDQTSKQLPLGAIASFRAVEISVVGESIGAFNFGVSLHLHYKLYTYEKIQAGVLSKRTRIPRIRLAMEGKFIDSLADLSGRVAIVTGYVLQVKF
jgi:hypothetical protein